MRRTRSVTAQRKRGMIVSGQEQVTKNLNKEIVALKNRSKAAMRASVLVIKAESMEHTPVEFSMLKNEHDTDVYEDNEGNISGVIFTGTHVSQDYALYVHENLEARHKPGKHARFLATALVVKAKDVFAILKAYTGIK